MKLQDFVFELPDELIADRPLSSRRASRLLVVPPGDRPLEDGRFTDLHQYLRAGDLLVFNDTRVVPARFLGRKESGGAVEVLVERVLDEHRVLAHTRSSKSPKPGTRLRLEDELDVEVLGRDGALFELYFHSEQTVWALMEAHGRIPLPPYIERDADESDRERYQTVYAQQPGAVAAPTAGLHFDPSMLTQLQAEGIELAYVTLHVGAGTFQPIRVDKIEDHVMHHERVSVSNEVVQQIEATRARGGRVIAVGTTVVRSLESASSSGVLQAFDGDTNIFIYPGYQFKVVDGLITNFHLPGSTLMLLVSALAGQEKIRHVYAHAIAQRYRFYSYGDAMFILPVDRNRAG